MINGYDFPEISYFRQGNAFTGSDGNSFRYRLVMEGDFKQGDAVLNAFVWYEDLCFECAESPIKESFEVTNDGLVKAIEWIFSKKQ